MTQSSAAKTDNLYNDLEAAKEVLDIEIQGLKALEDALNDKFVTALDKIYTMKGRLVVSGMGKSGHIARKIAATMASTGTPSLFVHPGEASHGDLGMISSDDVVVLLSNSGETSELKDIINYCSRFSITLIGVVRRKSSELANASDVALVLPEIPEASPVGAPTTSTTMMLALGDAMAMALLKRRGFGKADFNVFHPGGKLGAAFIKVKDIMHGSKELPVVHENTKMADVLIMMSSKGFGCACVLDMNEKLLGVITDGDLRRNMHDELPQHLASDIMTKDPVVLTPEQLASEALNIMNKHKITNLFVVDSEKNVHGVIHIHDLLRAGVA